MTDGERNLFLLIALLFVALFYVSHKERADLFTPRGLATMESRAR